MNLLIPKFIKYQLYLLQLENYELLRYWKLLIKKGLFPNKRQPLRKELVWSAKAKALMLMAVALHFLAVILAGLIAISTYKGTDGLFGFLIIVALAGLLFYFLWFSLALILIWPLDSFAKQVIIARAKSRIKNLKDLKIIGIAGSYGKTTMKQVLFEVLGAKFNVTATPESVNTPIGIARWILNKFDENLQVAIVEMGEHYSGDIEYLCKITPPDIAVVKGINEAHLERMKTLENITNTIFEVAGNAKPGATMILNGDDKNVMDNYKKYVWPDHKLLFYGTKNKSNFQFSIFPPKADLYDNFQFSAEKLGWEVEIEGLGNIFINLLGEYALNDVQAAIIIAKQLGMSDTEIKIGISKISPVEHRLQPITSANSVLIIDDSYNGNPDGAMEAIKVLSRFANRRKIYITPGLVETGKAAKKIHLEIGKQLAGVADVVILIKNSVTGFIEEGMKDEGLRIKDKISQVIWFNTAQEAHVGLKNILKPSDVILFQNDWGDQYL